MRSYLSSIELNRSAIVEAFIINLSDESTYPHGISRFIFSHGNRFPSNVTNMRLEKGTHVPVG